jgi:hypothetical protein
MSTPTQFSSREYLNKRLKSYIYYNRCCAQRLKSVLKFCETAARQIPFYKTRTGPVPGRSPTVQKPTDHSKHNLRVNPRVFRRARNVLDSQVTVIITQLMADTILPYVLVFLEIIPSSGETAPEYGATYRMLVCDCEWDKLCV